MTGILSFLVAQALPRYLFYGTLLFLLDFAIVYWLVAAAGADPAAAQLIGRSTGAVAGFFVHRHLTFGAASRRARFRIMQQGSGFFAAGLLTLFLSPALLIAFLEVNRGDLLTAKVLTEIVLVAINFLALRFIFKKRDAPA